MSIIKEEKTNCNERYTNTKSQEVVNTQVDSLAVGERPIT